MAKSNDLKSVSLTLMFIPRWILNQPKSWDNWPVQKGTYTPFTSQYYWDASFVTLIFSSKAPNRCWYWNKEVCMYLTSIYFSLNSLSDEMIEMYMHSSVSKFIVVGIIFSKISIIPNFLGISCLTTLQKIAHFLNISTNPWMLMKTNFIVHLYLLHVDFLSTTKLFLNSVQKKIAVKPKSTNTTQLIK